MVLKWQALLDRDFIEESRTEHGASTKLEYIGENIFSFITYDSNLTEDLSDQMLEVIENIINRTTFKYIEDERNYLRYIVMLNMPFMKDKIDWGTSIRGAWISPDELNGSYAIHTWKVPKKEIDAFLKELVIWSKQESQPSLQSI